MKARESDLLLRRRQRRRWLLPLVTFIVVAWALLESLRLWADRREIPVVVILQLPPTGTMAASLKAAGVTIVGTPVPYEQVTNPPISLADIRAIKRCLAHDRFLPLFPLQIEITNEEVSASFGWKANRRTNRMRETVVVFTHVNDRWHIQKIEEHSAGAHFARPPTLWENLLSYLPFTD